MDDWKQWIAVVLTLAGGSSLLWGIRQFAVLRRVEQGFRQVLLGKPDVRLVRTASDREPVLRLFDNLILQVDAHRRDSEFHRRRASTSTVLRDFQLSIRPPIQALRDLADALDRHARTAADPALEEFERRLRVILNELSRVADTTSGGGGSTPLEPGPIASDPAGLRAPRDPEGAA